ncbi:MAG: flagellar hook capping protein [Micrococcales bacterium]|nr:MAG: flagellar hook capping protein [Micrococcales bacterium]PIE27212.1 MAG: flagellar hook capping protein [Micrococcales bacterium]
MSQIAPVSSSVPPATSREDLLTEIEDKRTESVRTPSNELDKDAFLQLLVAQLRYQDPSKPMDASEFMAQNAQLTTVEKMTEMAEVTRSFFAVQQKMAATSMVGSIITWQATDGSIKTGTVDSASLATDTPTLTVDGRKVALDDVRSVAAPES